MGAQSGRIYNIRALGAAKTKKFAAAGCRVFRRVYWADQLQLGGAPCFTGCAMTPKTVVVGVETLRSLWKRPHGGQDSQGPHTYSRYR